VLLSNFIEVETDRIVAAGFLGVVDELFVFKFALERLLVLDLDVLFFELYVVALEEGEDGVDLLRVEDGFREKIRQFRRSLSTSSFGILQELGYGWIELEIIHRLTLYRAILKIQLHFSFQ